MDKVSLLSERGLNVYCVEIVRNFTQISYEIFLGYSLEDIMNNLKKDGERITINLVAMVDMKKIIEAINIPEKKDVSKEQFILNTKLIAGEYIKDIRDKNNLIRILDKVA